jgi:hypothetical protein
MVLFTQYGPVFDACAEGKGNTVTVRDAEAVQLLTVTVTV